MPVAGVAQRLSQVADGICVFHDLAGGRRGGEKPAGAGAKKIRLARPRETGAGRVSPSVLIIDAQSVKIAIPQEANYRS